VPRKCRIAAQAPTVQFLHLGRLGDRKGIDLVNASCGLPEACATARACDGGDGDVEGVRNWRSRSASRSMCIPGSTRPTRRCCQSDVFALPSRPKGVPMACSKAMANGCRRSPRRWAASRRVPPRPEGVLVHAGQRRADPRGDGAHDHQDDARLAAAAPRANARAQFDVHVYARRLADIYQRIAPVAEIQEIA
jgi:hypothetical protein